MTKIPSVEQEILKWMNAYIPEGKTIPVFEDLLEQYATEQRTALLTELRDSELLEEKKEHQDWCKLAGELEYSSCGCWKDHNDLAKAIKVHLDELIQFGV